MYVIGYLEQEFGVKASLFQRGTWCVKLKVPSVKGESLLGLGEEDRWQQQRRAQA